ncbi:hypothetical protein PLESTF_001367700, partial [Pleodorina starrii]
TTSGTLYFSGLLIDLLNRILITGNVSYQYDIYISPTNAGGTLGSNGVWSGVIGEVLSGRADVALFPLTRTASRLAAIDCTFSYYDAGLALLVEDGQTSPGPLSVLAPFEMTLWVTLLSTVVGVALLFWALDAYGRWIRAKQFDALKASGALSAKAVARAKREEGNPVLISFMAAAGAPERPGRNSWGVQVLYVVYCFFCLIVLSSYTANLTSFLAVRRAFVGVSGLQDLVRDNSLIGVNPGGSTAAYFSTSQDSLATQLQPNVRYCDSPTCVAWVRQGVVRAFVTDQPVLLYMSQQQPCDTAVVGDPFGPGNLVLGLQKNSSLLPLFNAAIQSFSEDGTLTSLRRAWFDGLSQCDSAGASLDNTRLSISQMLGAFVFLVMGVLVAFVTGTVENLKWCLARAYARSYSEAGGGLQNARASSPTALTASESQLLGRSPTLRQQASRLRAATWHRLSVGLLGIPMLPPQPAGEMDARGGPGVTAAAALPPPAAAAADDSSGSSTPTSQRGGGGGGGGALGSRIDPDQPQVCSRILVSSISQVPSPAPLERSSASCACGGGAGGAGKVDAAPSPRDIALLVQDCVGAASGKTTATAAAGSGCGGACLSKASTGDGCSGGGGGGGGFRKVSISGGGGGGGGCTAAVAEETSGGGSPRGGPLLPMPQLLPLMPALGPVLIDDSSCGRRRESDRSLPGQPSLPGSSSNSSCGTAATTPPLPLPQPSSPRTPAAAAAAAEAMRSSRVVPSRESSRSVGVVYGQPEGQQAQAQQSAQQSAAQPAAAAAAAAARGPSNAALTESLPHETELTTFSHVSSSNSSNNGSGGSEDGPGSNPRRTSLSFAANLLLAAPTVASGAAAAATAAQGSGRMSASGAWMCVAARGEEGSGGGV